MDNRSIEAFLENPEAFLEAWQGLYSKFAYSIKRRKAKVQTLNQHSHDLSIWATNQYAIKTRAYIRILNEIHGLIVETKRSIQVIDGPGKAAELAELKQLMATVRQETVSHGMLFCVKKYGQRIQALMDSYMLAVHYQKGGALDLIHEQDQAILAACGIFKNSGVQDLA